MTMREVKMGDPTNNRVQFEGDEQWYRTFSLLSPEGQREYHFTGKVPAACVAHLFQVALRQQREK